MQKGSSLKSVWTRIVAVALVLVGFGYWWMNSRNEQSVGEGNPIVTVKIPALNEAEKAGAEIFVQSCAACHGENAAGVQGSGPPLVHKIYEPSHHADGAIYLAVRNGVRSHHWPFGNMAPVDGLSDADVAKIIGFVRAMQRANGIS